MWRVHVQAASAPQGMPASKPQPADTPASCIADQRPAQPHPSPAKQDVSSPPFPKHFTLRTDACTPSPDTIVVSSAQATCRHKTVKTPITQDSEPDATGHSAGSTAVVTPPVTLNARSRSTHGLAADNRSSKLPTQCSETSDSGSPPLPVVWPPVTARCTPVQPHWGSAPLRCPASTPALPMLLLIDCMLDGAFWKLNVLVGVVLHVGVSERACFVCRPLRLKHPPRRIKAPGRQQRRSISSSLGSLACRWTMRPSPSGALPSP